MEDIRLPQTSSSLDDPGQSKSPKVIKTEDTRAIKFNEGQKKSVYYRLSLVKPGNKNVQPSGAPRAKTQPQRPDCVFVGEVVISKATASDGSCNTTRHPNSKPPKLASSRISQSNGHGQENTKRTKENNLKKAEDSKQAGNKVKAEEKPTIPKIKQKKNSTAADPRDLQKASKLRFFMHWGRRLIRKLDSLPPRPWETQEIPKALSHSQLSNAGRRPRVYPNVLRKLKSNHRNQMAVLKKNVHLRLSTSCHHLGRSGWYLWFFQPRTSLKLNLFLADHSLWHHVGLQCLTPPGLVLTQLSLLWSVHPSQRLHLRRFCPTAGPISTNSARAGLTNPTGPSVPQYAASRPAPYRSS